MNSRPSRFDYRAGEDVPDGRLFRLERFIGFGDPEEHRPGVWALIALLVVGAILISGLSLLVPHPTASGTSSGITLMGTMLVLLTQMTGDFFYRSHRRLSALLRVGARLVALPAVAALYAATAYWVDGARGALFVVGVFFAVMALAVLLGRISGLRRARGSGLR